MNCVDRRFDRTGSDGGTVVHIVDEHTETEQNPYDRGEKDHTKRVPPEHLGSKHVLIGLDAKEVENGGDDHSRRKMMITDGQQKQAESKLL